MRQQQGERQGAQDGQPDHAAAADAVAQWAAEQRAGGDGAEEHEQMQLGLRHGHAEAVDQIEREVAGEARQIHILGEDQRQQDADGAQSGAARQARGMMGAVGGVQSRQAVMAIPHTHIPQHGAGEQRQQREEREAALSPAHHHQRSGQRSQRLTDVAAHLEQGLRQSETCAAGHARDARGLGMKNGRAHAEQRRADEHGAIAVRHREFGQSREREHRAEGQKPRCRPAIRIQPGQRLKNRRGHLIGQGHQPHLSKREAKISLQRRINGRQQ
jgi:hypothetical protein